MPVNVLPWYTDSNIVLLTEAVHMANRMNVTFVAARGNENLNEFILPGVADDDWVILVGGLGDDGNWANFASQNADYTPNWGRNVDIAAPSEQGTIWSTCTHVISVDGMTHFGRTSGATPHVSGVVALLMSYLNNPNGLSDYNNLAPEDCEQIIQRSARSMPNGAPLPNDSVGYGRLDAGKALRMVEKSCNTLHHFGTKYFSNSIYKTLYSLSDTITFTERCANKNTPPNYLPKGKYILKTFQIQATVNHNLASTDTIVAYWPRPSSSEVWELFRNKKLRPRERDTITSCTQFQAILKGYVYQVSDTLGVTIGWWPCDTSFSTLSSNSSLFEYSVLTRTCAITGITAQNRNTTEVNLYPNPANNIHTIAIETSKPGKLNIELYDLTGRLVKTVYHGTTISNKILINSDISGLAESLYIYIIKVDDKILSKKFVKN
jgi:hypothetical protein